MAEKSARPFPRALRWVMPSLSHWLWLALFLILLADPWRTALVASDGDACMHWRVGEHMLQTGQIIRADVFSHTRYGQPIISKEWLGEIILALAARGLGGYFGLCVVTALVIATAFALLHWQLVRDGADILVATIVVMLAAWASATHWLARPHVFSILMIVLWNDALRNHERDGNARRLAVKLGVLTLFWVNLHGAYLAGALVLGAYGLGALLERNRPKLAALMGAALVCALISLLNPNGYHLHAHNLRFLNSNFLTDWLAEYASTNFHKPEARGFLVWLALIFLTLTLCRPKLAAGSAAVLISWTYFALYAGRNIPFLAILSAPILATAISEAVPEKWRGFSQRAAQTNAASGGWPLVAVLAIVAVVLFPQPTEMPASRWPTAAVKFIGDNPKKFSGNMFNQYAWGGYLMEALPEHKVFVDGRTDFYGDGLIREFEATAGVRTNWTQALEKYSVSWSLMPADHRMNLALALLPGWERVYSNDVATIYVKTP